MTDEVMSADTCRHCGKPRGDDEKAALAAGLPPSHVRGSDKPAFGLDWFCAHCEHWQDSMTCPTCGSNVRISTMPQELVPSAAKAKE